MNLGIPLMGALHIGFVLIVCLIIKITVLTFSAVFPLTYVKIKRF